MHRAPQRPRSELGTGRRQMQARPLWEMRASPWVSATARTDVMHHTRAGPSDACAPVAAGMGGGGSSRMAR